MVRTDSNLRGIQRQKHPHQYAKKHSSPPLTQPLYNITETAIKNIDQKGRIDPFFIGRKGRIDQLSTCAPKNITSDSVKYDYYRGKISQIVPNSVYPIGIWGHFGRYILVYRVYTMYISVMVALYKCKV